MKGLLFLGVIWSVANVHANLSINLIPTMTSATTPNGIVSASASLNSSYAAWYAFAYNLPNGNTQTWATSGNSGWLQYQFPIAHTVVKYDITNRNEPGVTRSPTSWTFQGSNNGSTWTVLDTQTGVSAWLSAANTTLSYTFTNTTPYTHYRIQVQNSDAYIGIGRLKMYEASISPHESFCATVTDVPSSECLALMSIFDSNNGTNWTTKNGW
jgi:hypothetical protein